VRRRAARRRQRRCHRLQTRHDECQVAGPDTNQGKEHRSPIPRRARLATILSRMVRLGRDGRDYRCDRHQEWRAQPNLLGWAGILGEGPSVAPGPLGPGVTPRWPWPSLPERSSVVNARRRAESGAMWLWRIAASAPGCGLRGKEVSALAATRSARSRAHTTRHGPRRVAWVRALGSDSRAVAALPIHEP